MNKTAISQLMGGSRGRMMRCPYLKSIPNSILILLSFYLSCAPKNPKTEKNLRKEAIITHKNITQYDTASKTIHVLVALCDNLYQGIVPVPEKIGNGQDPNNNLYWGCGYGIRTYFGKSKEWQLISKQKLDTLRLERLIFQHIDKKYYLVADAYDGQYIEECTEDFLYACAGIEKDTLHINHTIIGINGNAKLLAYIGHNGLMDFSLAQKFVNTDKQQRDCIILACISKNYFTPYLQSTKSNALLWTTGTMCPEAYTLHDALTGYTRGESAENIRQRAILAYAKHQKCSPKAARNLLVVGE